MFHHTGIFPVFHVSRIAGKFWLARSVVAQDNRLRPPPSPLMAGIHYPVRYLLSQGLSFRGVVAQVRRSCSEANAVDKVRDVSCTLHVARLDVLKAITPVSSILVP